MAICEYPQVPRTSLPQPQPQPQPQPRQSRDDQPPHTDNRFSFVPTPAEARGYSWHRHGTEPRQSEIPPLPQLPEHLNAHDDLASENIHQSQADHDPPAPAYSHYPDHPSRRFGVIDTSSRDSSDSSTTYRPSTSHTSDAQQEQLSLEDCKDDVTMQHAQIPVRSDTPHRPVLNTTLGPDINPLSPTTPTKAHMPSHNNTTNIAILPPSNPQTVLLTNFSPIPQPVRGGSWHYSLFSCGEPTTCLTSLFCPCITYGRTQYRLSQRSERKDPTNMLGFSACNGSCMAFGILCGVNAVLAAIQKTRVRKAYEMSGSEAGGLIDDCVKSVCCCCCSVAQDEKEIKLREEQARMVGGAKDGVEGRKKEGYVPVGGMSFLAPPPR